MHIYLFRKIIGYKLYQKNSGGIDTDKFNAFYDEFIKGKYENHLIIMDNAKFHKSKIVKDISPATYEELKITIDDIIKNKIKKEHLKNYFKYLFIQAKNYINTH